jgi:hypothetical protein
MEGGLSRGRELGGEVLFGGSYGGYGVEGAVAQFDPGVAGDVTGIEVFAITHDVPPVLEKVLKY